MIHYTNVEITNLGHAAYLMTEGYKLLGSEWRDGAVVFIFEPRAHRALDHYYNSRDQHLVTHYRKLLRLATDAKEVHGV